MVCYFLQYVWEGKFLETLAFVAFSSHVDSSFYNLLCDWPSNSWICIMIFYLSMFMFVLIWLEWKGKHTSIWTFSHLVDWNYMILVKEISEEGSLEWCCGAWGVPFLFLISIWGFLSPGWWLGFFLVGVIVWDADVEKGCACRRHRSFIRIVSVVEVYKH